MRSMLFVPADSERKMAKAVASQADAVIFDLEDAVLPEAKATARRHLREFLSAQPSAARHWVRVNGPESGFMVADLAAVGCLPIAGIVLPKIRGPEDILSLDGALSAIEATAARPSGALKIIALCTETPLALLRIAEIARCRSQRLAGLMWGGEDLSAALGAVSPRTPSGAWRPTYEYARIQCLLAAHAAGVAAIDTVFVDFKDAEGCRRSAQTAREDGFTAKLAIHPDQVPIINEAFTPTEAEVTRAKRVVAAFGSGAGAVALDGEMLDVPHLRAAERILAATRSP